MKTLIFYFYILIILFKTGNVLSNPNIFNVNNVEISGEISKNREELVNKAFKKAYDELINRLLLKEDFKKLNNIDRKQIKKLVSYYQIINLNDKENTVKINVFFDKDKMHSLFYNKNIKYSDIINTEVILFPLLKKEKKYFIYLKNYFYENWNNKNNDDLIQYTLPVENIESIESINLNKDNIYKLDTNFFFKEYVGTNVIFVNIEILDKSKAEVFLKAIIEGKAINKNLSIEKKATMEEKEFYDTIITEIKNITRDLIKSQNLIDIRTPSFLNVKIEMDKKNNLAEFSKRLKNIELIDNFYVQKINKNFVLVKIKYLGKIDKIIDKLKVEDINLIMIEGQWQLSVI